MAETFFGPWTIEVTTVVRISPLQLVVLGTVTDEGRYELDPAQPITLRLDGPTWTLGVDSFWPADGFVSRDTRRTTAFDQQDGLTAVVEAGRAPSNQIGPLWEYVRVRCVSRDPDLAPGPVGETPDFTIPGG